MAKWLTLWRFQALSLGEGRIGSFMRKVCPISWLGWSLNGVVSLMMHQSHHLKFDYFLMYAILQNVY